MRHKPVDFDELVKGLTHTTGERDLSIWGGRCESEDEVLALLRAWPNLDNIPYRIWEYSSEIKFESSTLPGSARWLERGELFGSGGNLSLRRDGDEFRWWFIGPAGTKPPEDFSANEANFWQRQEKDVSFYWNTHATLLWGERKSCLWFDDRVAPAKLDYPADEKWERVQVKYKTFSRNGQVEFVWLLGLEAYNG